MAEENNQSSQPVQQVSENLPQPAAQAATVIPERTFVSSIVMEVRNASQEITTKVNVPTQGIGQE